MTEKKEISAESLVCKLGVPKDKAPGYLSALYAALGKDGQPQRAINYLNFKITMRRELEGQNVI